MSEVEQARLDVLRGLYYSVNPDDAKEAVAALEATVRAEQNERVAKRIEVELDDDEYSAGQHRDTRRHARVARDTPTGEATP